MLKALIMRGGWKEHQPEEISKVFESILCGEGFEVKISDKLDCFSDTDYLKSLNLIVPVYTMGKISDEQCASVTNAVNDGVGIAGCHGGMCDAFRECTEWQFMTGGNWVAHPGNDGVKYRVHIKKSSSSPLIDGIDDFDVCSEQYYLHVDPAVNVLAVTYFPTAGGPHTSNGTVEMPVIWTKYWGKGKVFYNSLGHNSEIFNIKEVKELMRRGFLWAASGKGLKERL